MIKLITSLAVSLMLSAPAAAQDQIDEIVTYGSLWRFGGTGFSDEYDWMEQYYGDMYDYDYGYDYDGGASSGSSPDHDLLEEIEVAIKYRANQQLVIYEVIAYAKRNLYMMDHWNNGSYRDCYECLLDLASAVGMSDYVESLSYNELMIMSAEVRIAYQALTDMLWQHFQERPDRKEVFLNHYGNDATGWDILEYAYVFLNMDETHPIFENIVTAVSLFDNRFMAGFNQHLENNSDIKAVYDNILNSYNDPTGPVTDTIYTEINGDILFIHPEAWIPIGNNNNVDDDDSNNDVGDDGEDEGEEEGEE